MDKLKIYCMCLDNDYLKVVKKLDYIPVGLKNKNFSNEWLRDNTLKNILSILLEIGIDTGSILCRVYEKHNTILISFLRKVSIIFKKY